MIQNEDQIKACIFKIPDMEVQEEVHSSMCDYNMWDILISFDFISNMSPITH